MFLMIKSNVVKSSFVGSDGTGRRNGLQRMKTAIPLWAGKIGRGESVGGIRDVDESVSYNTLATGTDFIDGDQINSEANV